MAVVQARPRGAAALPATPPPAVAMTILAGGAISLQSYLDGRLGSEVGAATIAAAINSLVAFVATLAIVLATNALPKARARLRAVGRPPIWHFLGGFGGAALVLVAMVAGHIAGALIVDLIVSARGEAVTAATVIGVALTMIAVVVSGRGQAARYP